MAACVSRAYESRSDAASDKRKVERSLRTSVRIAYCEPCDAYHHESNIVVPGERGNLDERDRTILRRLALGMRYNEIASELGIKYEFVRRRVEELERRLGAISVPNLMAVAIFLRIIEIDDLVPKEQTYHGRT